MRRAIPHLLLASCFALLLLPQVFVVHQALDGDGAMVAQAPAMVWGLVRTTLVLSALSVTLAVVLGLGAAICVTRYDIPGRRLVSVLLCLPFAIPAYLLAGIALGASQGTSLPAPDNLWGAALILGLSTYPWVYLPAKAALVQHARQYHEAAQTLGLGRWQRIWRIHRGLLTPSVATGALLAFMAVLGDFGTVSLLGVKTLSVGIHDAMFGMYRRDWAAELALIGLALPVLAALAFAWANARRASYVPANRSAPLPPQRVGAIARWSMLGGLSVLLVAALGAPLAMLLRWAMDSVERRPLGDLPGHAWDTLLVTALVTAITVVLAFALTLALRRGRGLAGWGKAATLVNLNYAIPGIMLGIALLFTSSALPDGLASGLLSNSVGLLVIGGCLACLCFPFFALRAGLATIPRELDDLCATVGLRGTRRLLRIDLPLLRRSLACGALLVAVTMAKELPLSQVLQPFGYQSLSLRLYGFAGVGLLEESAIYALSLIALAIYPVVALDRLIMRSTDAAL